jgi:hypothetical protein
MENFEQFLEFKKTESLDSSKVHALQDMTSALRDVFKRYAKNTRKEAWEKLTSRKGMMQISKIINDPYHQTISDSIIRTLWSEK